MIAKIAVPNVDKIFDYTIPENMGEVQPGVRVVVPFGAGNRSAQGIVVGVAEQSDCTRLKAIKKQLDKTPLCTEELLRLAAWLEENTFCTLYTALKTVMPAGVSVKFNERYSLASGMEHEFKTEAELEILKRLREAKGALDFDVFADIKAARRVLSGLSRRGALIEITEDTQKVSQKYIRMTELDVDSDVVLDLLPAIVKKAPIQAKILEILMQAGSVPTSDVTAFSGGAQSALLALEKKGLVKIYQQQTERAVFLDSDFEKTTPHIPTPEQEIVLTNLKSMMDKGQTERVLLRGVTGSGKTEVFLQSIDYVCQKGKKAIVLVPEISLTPQMVERFVGRFGRRVSVLHSSLSLGERYDEWHRTLKGEVDVVIGARSAIFAPIQNIGMIILDEEQETTYKSETPPRYHTSDVAAWRAEQNNAVLLMASATPSVDSYYKAQSGEYTLFEMQNRYNNAQLPRVEIVDMRKELMTGNKSVFSRRLCEEIHKNIANREQTILFLNRRGYNTFVSCRSCGEAIICQNCNVTLTYHKKIDQLVCHYCDFCMKNPTQCPECGSPYIRYFGDGTQKIEDDIARLFPKASCLRMDMDTTSNKNSHQAILNRFRDEKIDILVGTQMVTKGLDFKNVTLVGVMAADLSLNMADFRAYERSFALFTQVCGRAGRGDSPGRAIIQTYQPHHFVLQLAKQHNYTDFYSDEILIRKKFNNPPYCDIIVIMATGDDEEKVKQRLEQAVALIDIENTQTTNDSVEADISRPPNGIAEHHAGGNEHSNIEILKPAPAHISKIKNKYRWRAIVKCADWREIYTSLERIAAQYGRSEDITVSIDINPGSFV